jgi:hypothetical protein
MPAFAPKTVRAANLPIESHLAPFWASLGPSRARQHDGGPVWTAINRTLGEDPTETGLDR